MSSNKLGVYITNSLWGMAISNYMFQCDTNRKEACQSLGNYYKGRQLNRDLYKGKK
ncbi:hypothetical protein VMF7928_00194 [Vibrio marisflavi CECT 7928]|uniref:Uncharacterized protein n=1 Tax=Vibrio marisflavi CECT 7928 TaxID=634439 RepID=A0ABN8DX31_9VIBR|nr:hypothetical protein VMF7928_00194 [Vibrio marisflavi CECT 7928]